MINLAVEMSHLNYTNNSVNMSDELKFNTQKLGRMEPLTAFAYKQKLGWDFHT
jgi:hypothetical protein